MMCEIIYFRPFDRFFNLPACDLSWNHEKATKVISTNGLSSTIGILACGLVFPKTWSSCTWLYCNRYQRSVAQKPVQVLSKRTDQHKRQALGPVLFGWFPVQVRKAWLNSESDMNLVHVRRASENNRKIWLFCPVVRGYLSKCMA